MTSADHDLVTVLRNASLELIGGRSMRDREKMLDQLIESALALVGAAGGVGISRSERGGVNTSNATSPSVYELDQLQNELREGPCLQAAEDPPPRGVLIAHDLEGEDAERWPHWGPVAVRYGTRSMLSVSLVGPDTGRYSALNFYAETRHAFDEDDIAIAGLFAGQVSALLYGADTAAQLTSALASRDLIGQAKGILAERFTVTVEEAFQLLVRSSQDTNMKLAEVARWVVDDTDRRVPPRPDDGRPVRGW